MAPIREMLFPKAAEGHDESLYSFVKPTTLLADLDHCAHIEKIDRYLGFEMWAGLAGTGAAIVVVSDQRLWQKPALYIFGGFTIFAGIGKLTTMFLSQRCNDRILERLGALPASRVDIVPDRHDEIDDDIDNAQRSIRDYATSAEAIARRATSPKTVTKGILIAATTTALAAVSAALAVFGLRGGTTMEPVTPSFGATLSPDASSFDRRNPIL